MKTNYVLIDYENVQPESLASLDTGNCQLLVFFGASQTKVRFETAAALQPMGGNAKYIKISGNGSNALDFHIAFYIGQIVANDPTACFHIVSKDTGFDPLIQHLMAKNIFVARSRHVGEISLVQKVVNTKPPLEKVAIIVAKLQQQGASKPRKVKTLLSTISSIFQKQLPDEELASLLDELQKRSYLAVIDTKIAYSLPATDSGSA